MYLKVLTLNTLLFALYFSFLFYSTLSWIKKTEWSIIADCYWSFREVSFHFKVQLREKQTAWNKKQEVQWSFSSSGYSSKVLHVLEKEQFGQNIR